MVKHMAGGLVIMLIASGIGLAHNSVRERPVKLIQTIKPVSTAGHGESGPGKPDETAMPRGAADTTAGGTDPLPEGAVSAEQMKVLFDNRSAVIIDARSASAFAEGHIPGAVNIPYDLLPQYLETLEMSAAPDEQIVCYCWSPTCDFSDQLATELKLMGYENVLVFTGGWDHWTTAGYPVETGTGE